MPDKLPVKTNNYGATVGGPIKHDKLFFFGSFEGYKRSQSLFTFFSVPDAALRAGDFSKALNTNGSLQQIYNPFTGNADGTGRAAVREQPDSGEHDQPDLAPDHEAGPAAQHRRHRRRRPDE